MTDLDLDALERAAVTRDPDLLLAIADELPELVAELRRLRGELSKQVQQLLARDPDSEPLALLPSVEDGVLKQLLGDAIEGYRLEERRRCAEELAAILPGPGVHPNLVALIAKWRAEWQE